jgi:hypothetical protein
MQRRLDQRTSHPRWQAYLAAHRPDPLPSGGFLASAGRQPPKDEREALITEARSCGAPRIAPRSVMSGVCGRVVPLARRLLWSERLEWEGVLGVNGRGADRLRLPRCAKAAGVRGDCVERSRLRFLGLFRMPRDHRSGRSCGDLLVDAESHTRSRSLLETVVEFAAAVDVAAGLPRRLRFR